MSTTDLFFLSADEKLTKSFWLNDNNELCKSSYPNTKLMTSHKEVITTPRDFYTAIKKHAALGHCLVKGRLIKDLNNESRAGSTKTDDTTNWLCFDLDGAPYTTPSEFMSAHEELSDLSYVVQYSASYGIMGKTDKLSCHIFVLLDGRIPAPMVKSWLMHINMRTKPTDTLRKAITLSRTGATLHWSVDITACQNDKLLYIAPPLLDKGVTSILTDTARIQLVPGKLNKLPVKRLQVAENLEKTKKKARDLLNEWRKAAGFNALRGEVRIIDEHEVQPKPGEAVITGYKEKGDFAYLNLNGGDSWAYYHPLNNFELIHNFKGEPSYYTKELLPGYYKDKRRTLMEKMGQPTEQGELILAFRDKATAKYWNGTWNPDEQKLDLYPATSETQLAHWMQNHGHLPYEVIPIWDLHFNPQSIEIVNEETKRINTYVPTQYFRLEHLPVKLDKAPTIKRIIMHAVSGGAMNETTEHFLNWLAVIFQKRVKPKTAWVLHGTEGTGKGLLISRVLTPLLGERYVVQKRASELEEKFTSWLEQAIIAFIDEIKVSASQRKDIISGDLRNFITEDWVTIRHMNRVAVQVMNYTGFIFASNEQDPIIIKHNDRRYNVGHFQNERLRITAAEISGIAGELSTFMSYLMTRTADEELAGTCLHNEAHAKVVEANRTSADVVTQQLANGDLMSLWDACSDLTLAAELYGSNSAFAHRYVDILKREIQALNDSKAHNTAKLTDSKFVVATTRLTREELLIIFEHCVGNMPKTPHKFTAFLKHRGITTERLRIGNALSYGLEVEWRVDTRWLTDRIKEFNKAEPKLRRIK